jgi:hypothetical protein
MTDMEFLAGALLYDDSLSIVREAEAVHNSRTAREAAREARRSR